MKQDDLLVLLFKIALIADVAAALAFIGDYTRLTRWGCWKNTVGRTIVWKDVMLAAAFTPSLLSFFWHFNRVTSRIAGWFDVCWFAGIAAVMVWRIVVFERIHRGKRPPDGSGL